MFTGMCEQQNSDQNPHKRKLIRIFIYLAHTYYWHKMASTMIKCLYVLSTLYPCCVSVGFCCAGLGFLFILIRWVPSVYMQSFVFIFVHNRFDIYEKENLKILIVSLFSLSLFCDPTSFHSLRTDMRHEAEVEMPLEVNLAKLTS